MKRSRMQRAAAFAAALLLILLFAATFFVGLFGGPDSKGLLKALIFTDFVLPVMIYGYLLLMKHRRGK